MASTGDEILAWLLPGVPEEERARVRRAVIAVRLLRDAARQGDVVRAGASWARARSELEHLDRARRLAAIEVLLRAHLEACLGGDSFLDLGTSAAPNERAWRTLLEGEPAPGLPPAPGAAPLVVAEALLAAAVSAGATRGWRELWGVRREHVARGAARAEPLWGRALRASGVPAPLRARFLAGLVAARLERFAPPSALELARKHEHLVPLDPGLRRLCGWSALLSGELGAARAWLTPEVRSSGAMLPRALEELALARTEWRELLTGRAREPSGPGELGRDTGRVALGADVLAVFALRPDGTRETLALDAAPALRAQAERWLAARGGAWKRAGEPEQRVLASARVQRLHRSASDACALPGVLGAGSAYALALAPLLDGRERVCGWLHLESRHHLLPAERELESLARAWSPLVAPREPAVSALTEAPRPAIMRRAWFAPDDPRGAVWRETVRALARRGSCRSLSWLERDGPELLVRAESGGPAWNELARASPALVRALDERVPQLSASLDGAGAVHAAASSCLVMPLLAPGAESELGFLVVESARAGELDRRAISACAEELQVLSPLWWASSFRAWHRARFGSDLAWDGAGRFLSSLEPTVRAASSARVPLFLQGPVGSGRRTLARWLHFRAGAGAEAFAEADDSPGRGTCLHELALLDRERQRELAGAMAQGNQRLLFLVEAPPHLLRERGELARELERRIDPLPLVVPPLAERRDEIPGLALVLARDVARREALASPSLEDGALATLWRQDWRGNVSELSSFVAQLVRAHPGEGIDAAGVLAAGRSRRLTLRERLPSLRPSDTDLLAALRATRHAGGAWNRTRAARYLGWDSDTLQQRLRERDLDGHEGESTARDRTVRPGPAAPAAPPLGDSHSSHTLDQGARCADNGSESRLDHDRSGTP